MLKSFISAIFLVFAFLFGMHQNQPVVTLRAVAAQSPIADHPVPALSVPAAAIKPALISEAPSAVPTIVRSSVPAPFVSGLVLGVATSVSDTVTHAELTAALDQFGNSLRSQLYSVTSSGSSFSGPAASTPVSFETFAAAQKIDKLSDVTITNATVHGVSGLTASDIPSLSGSYLPLAGGILTGALINSGTATSTFSGAVGIGTAAPAYTLDVNGTINASGGSRIGLKVRRRRRRS